MWRGEQESRAGHEDGEEEAPPLLGEGVSPQQLVATGVSPLSLIGRRPPAAVCRRRSGVLQGLDALAESVTEGPPSLGGAVQAVLHAAVDQNRLTLKIHVIR